MKTAQPLVLFPLPVCLHNCYLPGCLPPLLQFNTTMAISEFLGGLVSRISEENYEKTLSDYRLWLKIGAARGWIPDDQLQNAILENMRPELVYPSSSQLIHPTTHLLVQLITDTEPNPVSPTHVQLCQSSLKDFFADNSAFYFRTSVHSSDWRKFYTNVNFLAHWVNVGCLNVEDVRDHILQSLTCRPVPGFYQLCSLLILLKIAGATFAAYVDPSVMDHCLRVLKSSGFSLPVFIALAKVRAFYLDVETSNICRGNRMS